MQKMLYAWIATIALACAPMRAEEIQLKDVLLSNSLNANQIAGETEPLIRKKKSSRLPIEARWSEHL